MRDPNRSVASLVRWAGWFLCAVLLTAMVGCSPEQSTRDPVAAQTPTVQDPQAVEQALRERVQVYWQAKRIRDEVTVYHMEAKSVYKKSYTPQAHYRNRANKLRILGFKIQDIQIDGDGAKVSLELLHGLEFFGKTKPVKKQTRESWTLIDGQWYHGHSEKHKAQEQALDPPVGDYRGS